MVALRVNKDYIKSLVASVDKAGGMLQKLTDSLNDEVFEPFFKGDIETALSNLERVAGKKLSILDAFNLVSKTMKSIISLRVKIDTNYVEPPPPIDEKATNEFKEMCLNRLIQLGKLEEAAGVPKTEFSHVTRGPSYD